jgi:hypothetical protein
LVPQPPLESVPDVAPWLDAAELHSAPELQGNAPVVEQARDELEAASKALVSDRNGACQDICAV